MTSEEIRPLVKVFVEYAEVWGCCVFKGLT